MPSATRPKHHGTAHATQAPPGNTCPTHKCTSCSHAPYQTHIQHVGRVVWVCCLHACSSQPLRFAYSHLLRLRIANRFCLNRPQTICTMPHACMNPSHTFQCFQLLHNINIALPMQPEPSPLQQQSKPIPCGWTSNAHLLVAACAAYGLLLLPLLQPAMQQPLLPPSSGKYNTSSCTAALPQPLMPVVTHPSAQYIDTICSSGRAM